MPAPQPTVAPTPALLAEQIVAELHAQANADNVAGMARFGITAGNALGVSVPVMRAMAKDARKALGRDKPAWHELAALLWESDIHETRIMATFIDVPALVDEAQAESWVADLDSWDTCDQLVNNLLAESSFAWRKAAEWTGRTEEFVKRAGFVLGASLAVHDKAADDRHFLPLLALALREARDERNFVKKAVNWQIRQIGKRSPALNVAAITTCCRIFAENPKSKAARWTAKAALRELESKAVRARLGIS